MDIKTYPAIESKREGMAHFIQFLEEVEQKKNKKAKYFYKWKSVLSHWSSHQSASPKSDSILEVSFSKKNSFLDTTRSGINAARHKNDDKAKSNLAVYKAGFLTIKSILLLYIAKVFFELREFQKTQSIKAKYQKIMLRNLCKCIERHQDQVIRRYFEKWQSASSRSLKGIKVSDHLKGRLLLSLFKNQSFLNKRSAFFKWKVKSNTRYLKAVLAKFIMYPKINKYTSFWRLTTVLESKHDAIKPSFRFGRAKNFLFVLKSVLAKSEKRNISLSFYNIYKFSHLIKRRAQCLREFDKILKRKISDVFHKIKEAQYHSKVDENRNFALRALLKPPKAIHLAFYRWKQFILKEKIYYQNRTTLFLQAFPGTLDSLLKERLRYSFLKLANETDLSRKKRNATRTLIERQRAKWERAFWHWRKFNKHRDAQEKKIFNSFQRAATIIDKIQANKLKDTLTLLKRNVVSKENKKKKVIMILVNSITLQMHKFFRMWHSNKDNAKTMKSLSDTQKKFNEFNTHLNSQMRGLIMKTESAKKLLIFQKLALSYKIKLAFGFRKWKGYMERQKQIQVVRRSDKADLATLFRATNDVFSILNSALQRMSTSLYSKSNVNSNKAINIMRHYLHQRILRIFLKWHILVKADKKFVRGSKRMGKMRPEELQALQLVYLLDKLFYEPQLSKLKSAFNVFKTHNSNAKRKAFVLARLSQVIKTKQAYVFEIWKGVCTQKLLKSFYDVILLEKSLVNYANSVKAYAFHKICTAGLLEYWRTFNSALWKWKLANVEARYFSKQKSVITKSKAVFTLVTIFNRGINDSLRTTFELLKMENKQRNIE